MAATSRDWEGSSTRSVSCAGAEGGSVPPVSRHYLSTPAIRICELPYCVAFAHRSSLIGTPILCRIVLTDDNLDFNGRSFYSNQAVKSGTAVGAWGSGAGSARYALLSRCADASACGAILRPPIAQRIGHAQSTATFPKAAPAESAASSSRDSTTADFATNCQVFDEQAIYPGFDMNLRTHENEISQKTSNIRKSVHQYRRYNCIVD